MAEEAFTTATKSCCALVMDQIKKVLSYIWRYNNNMNDLRSRHHDLEILKLQIEREVEDGERRLETIGPSIKDWLEEAEVFLADGWSGFMAENRIRQKDQCCFGLVHMNLKYRYLMSKKAAKKFESTEKIIKKMQDGGSRAITLHGEPPKLGSMSIAYSKSLASREWILNKIMEALKDKSVRVIGIYGMGGVGKTILIKEVARRMEVDELSNKVVIAEVLQIPDVFKMQQQTPDIFKIQQQIAERIGLPLQGIESTNERALRIHKGLMQLKHKEKDDQMSKKGMRQVVVILDNMWEKLDLDKVGIPHDCKIVLTTRSELVCREMGADKKFVVSVLNDKEATELFLERIGRLADHDDRYKSMTDELVKKCRGLPFAIVALASTLRGRNLSGWQHAVAQLRSSVSARVGGAMEENVYPIIEWSYNFITCKEKKKFFLLCCLFPLGSSIAIQDLMRYGAGLGLFQYINSLDDAIKHADSWADELKSLSLLLEAEDKQHVKIHDIIRDASMSIAAKGENIFHVGTFPRWLLKETFRTYTAISMTLKDNHEPLSGFKFPKLEMLLLKGSKPSKFSHNFFQGMKNLKVLVISDMKFRILPSSIIQLKKLRTLHLERCELNDISAITSLINLLFLSLRESKIHELPKELGNLGKLKLLDLTGCSTLQKIPAGVIARLTNLEGLYMMDSFSRWHSENFELSSRDEPDHDKEMASLNELKSLSHLAMLEIHVPSIHLQLDNLLFRRLSRFSISIGIYIKEEHKCHHSKLLFLEKVDASRPLQQSINRLLKETEHLSLKGISALNNVVDSLDKDGFRNLKCLLVQNCSGMKYVVTTNELNEEDDAFSKLEKLTVRGEMDNLKVICHGPPLDYSFHHLKKLELSELRHLQNFWDDYNMHSNQPFFNKKMKFPSLEELKISKVDGIKELWHLRDVDEKVSAFPKLVHLELDSLPEMRSIWMSNDIIIHHSFRNLKNLTVSRCPNLEILCPLFVAAILEELDTLIVANNKNMKAIIAKETGEMENNTEITIFPKLRIIFLVNLPNLKYFFRGSNKLVFSSLESFGCYNLKKMVAFVSSKYPEDSDVLFNDKVALPVIKRIKMSYVNELQEIWGSHIDARSFNELESLEIAFAGKVSKVFSLNTIKQMRNLKKLDLQQFQLAEEFIGRIGFYNEDVENSSLLPQLKRLRLDSFPLLKQIKWREHTLRNLCYLKISKIHGLTSLFPASIGERLVNLEELDVSDCQMMEEIVEREPRETNTVEVKVVFPHLHILKLGNLPALRSLSSDNVTIEFPSIKEVVFDKFENPILLDLLQSLQRVKGLQLGGCESLLKSYDLEGLAFAFPPHLRTLKLYDMHNLQEIPWKVFPIEKIRYLNIFNISGLKFLFPASMCSERFMKLEKIHIDNCNDIEQVVAQESIEDTFNNAASTTIVLPRVKIIELNNLPSLRCFNFENYYAFEFSSLEEVEIKRCPVMETFSYGSLNTPNLHKISINRNVEEEHVDPNTVIKKRFHESSDNVEESLEYLRYLFPDWESSNDAEESSESLWYRFPDWDF